MEEEKVEEHQRVLGVIPNFYVEYDRQDVVPLPAMLKFKLALKASTDMVSLAAAGFLAGMTQAAKSPIMWKAPRATGSASARLTQKARATS